MSLTKEELKYHKRLNNLREVVDTDPEWATEYIIELEDRVEQLTMLCDDIEDKLKQLKNK